MRPLIIFAFITSLSACGTSQYKNASGDNVNPYATEAYFNEIFRRLQAASTEGPEDQRPLPGELPPRVKRAFFPNAQIFLALPRGKTMNVAVNVDTNGAVESIDFDGVYDPQLMQEIRKTVELWEFYPYTLQGKVTPFRVVLPLKRG